MGRDRRILTTHSDETIALGIEIGKSLLPGAIVCLFGDLAAGKTTLIKGIAKGFCQVDFEEVNSPTFTYLNIYGAEKQVFHFDLYRLQDPEEFLAMGFEEYLFSNGISCIEWSERIEEILPKEVLSIHLAHQENNCRVIQCDFKILNF